MSTLAVPTLEEALVLESATSEMFKQSSDLPIEVANEVMNELTGTFIPQLALIDPRAADELADILARLIIAGSLNVLAIQAGFDPAATLKLLREHHALQDAMGAMKTNADATNEEDSVEPIDMAAWAKSRKDSRVND